VRAVLGWAFAAALLAGGLGFVALTCAACVQTWRGEASSEAIGGHDVADDMRDTDEEFARFMTEYDHEGGER